MGSGEESVDHFALRYRGCGLVGLLACLLICGRQLHTFIFRHRRISALGVGCPPTMVGGFLGLGCLIILKEWFGYDWAVDKVRLIIDWLFIACCRIAGVALPIKGLSHLQCSLLLAGTRSTARNEHQPRAPRFRSAHPGLRCRVELGPEPRRQQRCPEFGRRR